MFDVLEIIAKTGNYSYVSDRDYKDAKKYGLVASPSSLTRTGKKLLKAGQHFENTYIELSKSEKALTKFSSKLETVGMLEEDDEYGEYYRYNYISTGQNAYVRLCYTLLHHFGDKKFKFLDVGCGKGFLLSQLKSFLPHNSYNGIELVEKYAHVAEEEFGLAVYNCDALKFGNYCQYDFVYLYRPIADEKVYRKLIKKIWHDMKPGAVLCQSYLAYNPISQEEEKEDYILTLKK